jgi:eukaryotic-like serine/threonine-protein kinase
MPPKSQAAELVGRTLGHFHVLAEIGAGGMGVVYRARDERLQRDIALKVLPATALSDPAARARLLNEARIASALNHPHICTIHEVGEAGGQIFIAMELVDGQPLTAFLLSTGLPAENVVRYGIQIADALAHAHENGVVHRDLKCANVMVTREGRVKILDFGLATHGEGELSDVTRSAASLAEAGDIAGTLPFMAPEVLRGERGDSRSDVWALGVVLYEMASGRRPFTGESGYELTSAILRDPPAPLPATVSPGLQAIIKRCLAKGPMERYRRAGEIRAALEAVGLSFGSPPAFSRPAVTDSAGTARASRRAGLLGHPALVAAGLLVLAALAWLGADRLRHRGAGTSGAPTIRSIAVLPLLNMSADHSEEYFADGMTESLTSSLAQIRALRVTSRTSVMQYKGTRKPVPQIARELNVDSVVEGSILRAGGRVKITAQLIRAADDTHLWAREYERDVRDVLTLQSEVAREIAGEIKIEVTPSERARLGRERPVNPEAHELYLRGRFALTRAADEQAIRKAIELFQQALALDPSNAPAYAGLADAYQSLTDYYVAPKEVMPQARAAAEKALELDETLADAHNSLAYESFIFEWDFPLAEKEVRRALELNPSYAPAHDTYAAYLTAMGRFEEAERESRRAADLDPFAVIIAVNRSWYLTVARKYDEAIEVVRKTVDLEPGCGQCFAQLSLALACRGDYAAAIESGRKGAQLDSSPLVLAFLGTSYALAGREVETRQVIAQLKEISKSRFLCPYEIGVAYLHLGEKDEALRWLEKGYEERSYCMIWLKTDPRLDPLRSDPRLTGIMRRIGLPVT